VGLITGQMPMSGGGMGTNVGGILTCVWIMSLSPARALTFQFLASDQLYLPMSDSTSVAGLGDGAYWNGHALNVKVQSGSWQMLEVIPDGLPNAQSVAQDAAQLVLQRLP
jgi:hypothetical protein